MKSGIKTRISRELVFHFKTKLKLYRSETESRLGAKIYCTITTILHLLKVRNEREIYVYFFSHGNDGVALQHCILGRCLRLPQCPPLEQEYRIDVHRVDGSAVICEHRR